MGRSIYPSGYALLAALEVPGVSREDIRPLEVPDKDHLEVRPVTDAIVREKFEPRSNMFPHVNGEVLNDEMVIIHSSGSAGEPKICEPYTGVHLPGVLGNVGGRSKALWERHSLDASPKGPGSRAIQARTPVVQPATMPMVHFAAPVNGLAGVRVAHPYCRLMDVIIMPGPMSVADAAASILVLSKPFAHRGSVWSGC